MELTNLPAVSVPMPWQGEAWGRFHEQLEAGSLPHALLFAGAAGTGKGRLALALARLLLCQRPAFGSNCGECHPCHLSASGSHGDLRWLQPQEKSRVIKVDQVRAVVEFATKTASFGERKVVVLSPADALNHNAANSLLKCLEEPAPGTHLILVCHRLHGVPATIRSRCQIVRFPIPEEGDSVQWLTEQTADEQLSRRLLSSADGSPLMAEQLYLDGTGDELQAMQAGLAALRGQQIASAEVAALFGDRPADEIIAILRSNLQTWLRSCDRPELTGASARGGFELLEELQRLQGAINAGANPNRQLLLETLLNRYRLELGGSKLGGSIGANNRGAVF
jgi:DNA polymerase III subunit delta'